MKGKIHSTRFTALNLKRPFFLWGHYKMKKMKRVFSKLKPFVMYNTLLVALQSHCQLGKCIRIAGGGCTSVPPVTQLPFLVQVGDMWLCVIKPLTAF